MAHNLAYSSDSNSADLSEHAEPSCSTNYYGYTQYASKLPKFPTGSWRSPSYSESSESTSSKSSLFSDSPSIQQSFSPIGVISPQSTPSPPPIREPWGSSSSNSICPLHFIGYKYYCQTCCMYVCEKCGLFIHIGHMTNLVNTAVELFIKQGGVMLSHILKELQALNEEIRNVEMSIIILQERAEKSTADDLDQCWQNVKMFFDRRHNYLARDIRSAEGTKFQVLKNRLSSLKKYRSSLVELATRQRSAMDDFRKIQDPLHLKIENDRAQGVTFDVQSNRQLVQGIEDEWSSFAASEEQINQVVSNFGSGAVSNPGPIGDKRNLGRVGNLHNSISPLGNFLQKNPMPNKSILQNQMINHLSNNHLVNNHLPNNHLSNNHLPNNHLPNSHLPNNHLPNSFFFNNTLPVNSFRNVFICSPIPRSMIPAGRAVSSCKEKVVAWPMKRFGGQFRPLVQILGQQLEDPNHPENLCRPWGVACDSESNIYIADRSNNRIVVFLDTGVWIRNFGCYGTGQGQFNRPAGIAIDERRRVIVADKDNHRIQIFTTSGEFLSMFGNKGSECGEFNYPWDVATNSRCDIVVTDTRNHRIQLFSGEGVFLRQFSLDSLNCKTKYLESPRGLAFDPEGRVVVTDFNSHRVFYIEFNFSRAHIMTCDGEPVQFNRPQGVAVDDEGNVIVADSRSYKIKIFNKFGVQQTEFGKSGAGLDEMDRPSGISLLPDGRIVYVDFGNNRVVIH